MPQRRNKKSQTSKKQAYNYFTVLAYREMAITLNRLLCSERTRGKTVRCCCTASKVLFQWGKKQNIQRPQAEAGPWKTSSHWQLSVRWPFQQKKKTSQRCLNREAAAATVTNDTSWVTSAPLNVNVSVKTSRRLGVQLPGQFVLSRRP